MWGKGTHTAGGNVNWTLLEDSLLVYSKNQNVYVHWPKVLCLEIYPKEIDTLYIYIYKEF